ncbi:MAG: hypothetical protein HW391_45 [Chloroflexi bacterium]|nr:hypothetical protein [Chloroflexota bacterium]
MATDGQFDQTISTWFEETAPGPLPGRVLDATFEQTRRSRQHVGWRALLGRFPMPRFVPALGSAVVVVVAAALALNFYANRPSIGGPVFQGTWVSTTDADGGTQTMTIGATGDGAVEIVVTDDVASVCSGGPSTMTGTGKLEGSTRLVIPSPVYTCDDGSEPDVLSGPPLEEQLRNLTFVLDPEAETLTDNFGGLWLREGAELPEPAISGEMWPQSTLEEVQAAQELADAGDPAATWQLEPELVSVESEEPDQVELVERFLREVLGWEGYLFYPAEAGRARNGEYVDLVGQRYLRCAPGRTNLMYPPGPQPERGELCAPTIDDLTYETVSLDLAQLDRRGPDGIWVVAQWRSAAPFAQADPVTVEAQGRERLEEFLAARIAGDGGEGLVVLGQVVVNVPLLYATTSGAPYARYEIERVEGLQWPSGAMTFSARLFTDGDTTVVEQEIKWYPSSGLFMDDDATTENGQAVVLSYTSSDGEVTVSAPSTWSAWLPGKGEQALDVWFGALWRPESNFGSGERVEFVDPVAYDAWCAAQGGSPLLSAPADAAAIAQQVMADPNLETTAPVAARVGGVEAVSIDVALAPGGRTCGIGMIDISRWIHALWDPGWRLRLYLVDLPAGMSVQTLAITVVAPEERFDEVIAETAPIIESIEFHPR